MMVEDKSKELRKLITKDDSVIEYVSVNVQITKQELLEISKYLEFTQERINQMILIDQNSNHGPIETGKLYLVAHKYTCFSLASCNDYYYFLMKFPNDVYALVINDRGCMGNRFIHQCSIESVQGISTFCYESDYWMLQNFNDETDSYEQYDDEEDDDEEDDDESNDEELENKSKLEKPSEDDDDSSNHSEYLISPVFKEWAKQMNEKGLIDALN